jgi:hypothetical protein
MQTNRNQLDRETLGGRTQRGLLKGERINGLGADWDDPATIAMAVPDAPAQGSFGAMQSTLAYYIASLQGATPGAPHRLPRLIAPGARKASASRPTDLNRSPSPAQPAPGNHRALPEPRRWRRRPKAVGLLSVKAIKLRNSSIGNKQKGMKYGKANG